MTLPHHYASLLARFGAHRSISTDPAFQEQVSATADDLAAWLTEQGFATELIEGYDNPLILARYAPDPTKPTALVYGHYDVQPAAQDDGWEQDPFLITLRDGRYVGRGAVDNKGQFLIHLAAISQLIADGTLAWNVEVLLEGNEETGSHGITRYLQEHPEKVTATAAMVSDGEIHSLQPKLEIGFRGTIQIDVVLRTSDRDLHSGLFGGTVPNAARELCALLDSLYGMEAELNVEGIEEGAHRPSEQELEWAARSVPPTSDQRLLSGTREVWSEPGQTLGSQLVFRPAIEVIGLGAGYMGPGFRNGIPGTAQAKLNVRIVPGQDPEQAYQAVCAHLRAHAPAYVDLEISHDGHGGGILVDASRPIVRHAAELLEQVYGMPPQMAYCGASLPFLLGFQSVPGLDLLVIPLGNDNCLMHAVGENIAVANAEKGLAFSQAFFATAPPDPDL